VDIIKDGRVIKSYSKGIFLGVGAGDITYQLRGEK
jgi:UDP-N-acetylmuramate--alanine ligase